VALAPIQPSTKTRAWPDDARGWCGGIDVEADTVELPDGVVANRHAVVFTMNLFSKMPAGVPPERGTR
jgi:hypothetical protein